MNDIRWKQRFNNYLKAFQTLAEAVELSEQRELSDLEMQGLIQRFEYTHELAWKTLKDFLQYNGIDVKLPREIIKQAFANEIIIDGQLWIDMLEDRNLIAHTYDEERAQLAISHICESYITGLTQLQQYLQERL